MRLKITSRHTHTWVGGFQLRAGETVLDEAEIPNHARSRIAELARAGFLDVEPHQEGVGPEAVQAFLDAPVPPEPKKVCKECERLQGPCSVDCYLEGGHDPLGFDAFLRVLEARQTGGVDDSPTTPQTPKAKEKRGSDKGARTR